MYIANTNYGSNTPHTYDTQNPSHVRVYVHSIWAEPSEYHVDELTSCGTCVLFVWAHTDSRAVGINPLSLHSRKRKHAQRTQNMYARTAYGTPTDCAFNNNTPPFLSQLLFYISIVFCLSSEHCSEWNSECRAETALYVQKIRTRWGLPAAEQYNWHVRRRSKKNASQSRTGAHSKFVRADKTELFGLNGSSHSDSQSLCRDNRMRR